MGLDRCKKCSVFGEVQYHHPFPARWGGRGKQNRDTHPLCFRCHRKADDITFDIDADYGITSRNTARRHLDVFIEAFVIFMNQRV